MISRQAGAYNNHNRHIFDGPNFELRQLDPKITASRRLENFVYDIARIDDALNWLPARLTALSYALLGRTRQALALILGLPEGQVRQG